MMLKTNSGYGEKAISSGSELLDYYTWLLSVHANVNSNQRDVWKKEVSTVRSLIERKFVDINVESE